MKKIFGALASTALVTVALSPYAWCSQDDLRTEAAAPRTASGAAAERVADVEPGATATDEGPRPSAHALLDTAIQHLEAVAVEPGSVDAGWRAEVERSLRLLEERLDRSAADPATVEPKAAPPASNDARTVADPDPADGASKRAKEATSRPARTPSTRATERCACPSSSAARSAEEPEEVVEIVRPYGSDPGLVIEIIRGRDGDSHRRIRTVRPEERDARLDGGPR